MKRLQRIIGIFLLTLMLLFAFTVPAYAEGQNGTTLIAEVTTSSYWNIVYGWTIDKSAAPDTWELFAGDSGTSQYTITVTKDDGASEAYLEGEVYVTNGGAVATENLEINTDLFKTGGQNPPVLNTVTVDVSGNPVLDPGETGVYAYNISIPTPVPGATYKVTAHITITNHSGSLGELFGPSPSATTTLPATPTIINDTINVDDTNGGSWEFSDSGAVTYDATFTEAGVFDNTATIRETGQSDDASVTVNVYSLEVNKTAETDFTRTYLWAIDKSADASSLLLTLGQVSPPVNYSVTVTNTGFVDSDFNVTGSITVFNPAPIDAVITGVADILPAEVAGTVEIAAAVDYPYIIPAGGELTLLYSVALPEVMAFENTGEVTIQNFDYGLAGNTEAGTTSFSAVAPADFGAAVMTEVDEVISVMDTFAGSLGEVAIADSPKTFTYSRTFGPYSAYGTYEEINTASFVTNDTGTTGEDTWTVTINVPQTGGTLTQGYWKTHSEFGPAPYDDTWAQLPNGASTIFFLSGQSYYNVLQTPPAGNSYYQLAHQYIAAKLNILNGTSAPDEVISAMAQAKSLFNTYTPANINKNKTLKSLFTSLASLLDQYNTGVIGPGHASE